MLERRRRKEEASKAGQHSKPKAVIFPKKTELPRVGFKPTTLYTLDRVLYELSYMFMYTRTYTCIHPGMADSIALQTHSYKSTHSLTHSPTHPPTHPPTHSLTHPLTHSPTLLPTHSLTHTPTRLAHSHSHTDTRLAHSHSHTHTDTHTHSHSPLCPLCDIGCLH